MLDLFLQDIVGGEPDGVEAAMLLQVLVHPRAGEGGVRPEVPAHPSPLIADHDGLQHFPPVVGTVGGAFLFPMHLAVGAVHVQDDVPVGCAGHPLLHPTER